MRENKHSIIVVCDFADALFESIRWGEAPWWPKNSLMRFVRQDQGPVKKGARYRQKVLLPFAPSWDVEVESVTDKGITRRFLNGMFEGGETVCIENIGRELKVHYEMTYEIRGFWNNILWALVFRKLHDVNIEAILRNLKRFLEKGEE